MKILGVEGDTLKIKVDWSPDPMIAIYYKWWLFYFKT